MKTSIKTKVLANFDQISRFITKSAILTPPRYLRFSLYFLRGGEATAQPILVPLGAHYVSVAILVVVSGGVDIWVAPRLVQPKICPQHYKWLVWL